MYGNLISLRQLLSVKFSESWQQRNVIVNSGDDEDQSSHMGLLFHIKQTNKPTHRDTDTHFSELQNHMTSRDFLESVHNTLFCKSKLQSMLPEYQRWHFRCKRHVTVWHLDEKNYMQYSNIKKITDVQVMVVSFDSTNTLYSIILSSGKLHFGISNLKLNIGRRRTSTVL